MNSFIKSSLCLSVLFFTSVTVSESDTVFVESALLPKAETGALRFLDNHPKYDGRGVIIAIFDSGVDPGAAGLTRTTDGQPKIIDIIDATGSGDIPMSAPIKADNGLLPGQSGRSLKINKKWKNPTGNYRIGLKAAYDIYPSDLISRIKSERTRKWKSAQRKREAQLLSALAAPDSKVSKKERQARLDLLREATKKHSDPGPVYDCITFHDGTAWRAVVDTDEDGDLADEKLLTDYRDELQYATFDDASRLNFSVNIYEDGKLLSLVTVAGDHGTHVAGITAAHFPERPQRNGLAPGAQIISVKIGDTRLDGMETGAALLRGLKRVTEMNCDMINMSYGEAASVANQGRLIEEFNQIVREKNVIFVSSAGNSGPALSTVGAPGGSSAEVIGVGAYVSPEMAEVEYTLRDKIAGLPYTWTSRGPTTDGDFGVDIFAPGGAVAPIPTYELQPNRRMNGTSMASPNACGNIALMLSGLKQEEKKFTPSSILRSLQATANTLQTVDPTAQGAGLIQIDKAFEHHITNEFDAHFVDLKVRVASRDNARGFYLRDAADINSPVQGTVRVTPELRDIADNDFKLQYDVPVLLECSADWVDVGSHLLITHEGASFETLIDATKLKAGLHATEIIARHADNQKQGPLFRVPIVVTVPEKLTANHFVTKLKASAGSLSRTFLTPPTGSRFAELRLKKVIGPGSSLFYIHNVQLVPGKSFEEHESKSTVSLKRDETFVRRIPVIAGHTLEVCIGQYWSNLGKSDLELEVKFHGVSPSEESINLPSSGEAASLRIHSALEFSHCHLSGFLDRCQRILHPLQVKTNQLSIERDGLWDDQYVWQSVLHYEFEVATKTSVKLLPPGFQDLIYDLPVHSLRIFLFDQNKRLVAADDMYSGRIALKKGKYSLQVELRHLDRSALKKFDKLPMIVEQDIDRIGLKFYDSHIDAVGESNNFSRLELATGDSHQLWTRLPFSQSLPSKASNGDRLLGTISLIQDDPNPITVDYVIANHRPPNTANSTDQPITNLINAERRFLINSLKTLDWSKHQPQIEQITERINNLAPESRELLIARLHLADNDERKQRLPEVIRLADKVIGSVPQAKLQRYFGVRQSPDTPEEKEVHKEMEAAKASLIDALYRKGRALAYMELPEVIESQPIKNQENHNKRLSNHFQQLSRWVDTTTEEYFLLHIRLERRKGNFAQAIQLLNQHDGNGQPVYLHHKKRRDLYELLGWHDWQQYEQNWMLRYFPKDKVPF